MGESPFKTQQYKIISEKEIKNGRSNIMAPRYRTRILGNF